MKITKADVFAFLGILGTTLITTLITRFTEKKDMQETVAAVLAEERRQLEEEAKNEKA